MNGCFAVRTHRSQPGSRKCGKNPRKPLGTCRASPISMARRRVSCLFAAVLLAACGNEDSGQTGGLGGTASSTGGESAGGASGSGGGAGSAGTPGSGGSSASGGSSGASGSGGAAGAAGGSGGSAGVGGAGGGGGTGGTGGGASSLHPNLPPSYTLVGERYFKQRYTVVGGTPSIEGGFFDDPGHKYPVVVDVSQVGNGAGLLELAPGQNVQPAKVGTTVGQVFFPTGFANWGTSPGMMSTHVPGGTTSVYVAWHSRCRRIGSVIRTASRSGCPAPGRPRPASTRW